MGVFDDLFAKAKAIADKNGDGKIDSADLELLKADLDEGGKKKLSELQDFADKNGDGKIDLEDLKAAGGDIASSAKGAFDSAGKAAGDAKDKLFGGK